MDEEEGRGPTETVLHVPAVVSAGGVCGEDSEDLFAGVPSASPAEAGA